MRSGAASLSHRQENTRPCAVASVHSLVLLLFSVSTFAQTAQVGGGARAKSSERLQVEYVHYRPAQWEREKVKELESEHPNQGGMNYVYFRNRGDKAVDAAGGAA